MRRVLVLLLILGTAFGASPALAKKQPAPSGTDPTHSLVQQRAIAIIAKH